MNILDAALNWALDAVNVLGYPKDKATVPKTEADWCKTLRIVKFASFEIVGSSTQQMRRMNITIARDQQDVSIEARKQVSEAYVD